MRIKDIQKVVKAKTDSGDDPEKNYCDLIGAVSLPTIKLWRKIINTTSPVTLPSLPAFPCTVRTKAVIVTV